MRFIDLETWPRYNHFKLFNALASPHFSMCANVDLSVFCPAVKRCGISFSVAILYAITLAANAVPEFRYRIRKEKVVEHDQVHPSTTILSQNDLFSFCTFDFNDNFSVFSSEATKAIADVKEHQTIDYETERDDLLFMTSIPWVSFTAFTHPIDLNPVDSIPRFAWGKYFEEGKLLKMPLNAQVHHALVDGIHVGRFYDHMQKILFHPDFLTGID